MRVLVCPLDAVPRIMAQHQPQAVVTLLAPPAEPPALELPPERRLTLAFPDIPGPAPGPAPPYLSWIQASVGSMVRVITVDEVIFFQSDAKYTRVATSQVEALIRVPVKDLAAQLDPEEFIQISRGAIVNRRRIEAIYRREGQVEIRLKGRPEVLQVSAGFQAQPALRQM